MPSPIANAVPKTSNGPWDMLSGMLSTADWNGESRAGTVPVAVDLRRIADNGHQDRREDYEVLGRALYRRERQHVLITGRMGVGKTATVRELARRAATGVTQALWRLHSGGPESDCSLADCISAEAWSICGEE